MKAQASRDCGLLPLPSQSRMFPTLATLKVPNSGKPEFGWERGGVRGYDREVGSPSPPPSPQPKSDVSDFGHEIE
jgi:hypothetical protein